MPDGKAVLDVFLTDAPVKNVTVYLDRAEISREWRTHLEPWSGEQDVILRGLPATLNPKSIRVTIQGDGVQGSIKTVLVLNGKAQFNQDAPTEEQLAKTLVKKQMQATSLQGKIARVSQQRKVWDQFVDSASKGTVSNLTSATDFASLLRTYDNECSKLESELQELRESFEKNISSQQAKKKELDLLKSQNLIRDIKITVVSQVAGEVLFKLSYTVNDARWTPTYDFKMFIDHQRLQVFYNGALHQSSGEDWTEVEMTLATVPPRSFDEVPLHKLNDAPSSSSIPLDGMFHDDAGMLRKSSISILDKSAEFVVGETQESREESARCMTVSGVNQQLSESPDPVSFVISEKVTVPSGGTQISVKATSFTIEALVNRECTPNISPFVYANTTGYNSSPFLLMAGPANLYLDGEFVATQPIRTIRSLEHFSLWLGVDPQVRIQHKVPLKVTSDTVASRTNYIIDMFTYGFEIINNRKEQVTVTAFWNIAKQNARNFSPLTFVDAPSQLFVEGGSREIKSGSFVNQTDVEWCVQIPAQQQHTATLVMKSERPRPASAPAASLLQVPTNASLAGSINGLSRQGSPVVERKEPESTKDAQPKGRSWLRK